MLQQTAPLKGTAALAAILAAQRDWRLRNPEALGLAGHRKRLKRLLRAILIGPRHNPVQLLYPPYTLITCFLIRMVAARLGGL